MRLFQMKYFLWISLLMMVGCSATKEYVNRSAPPSLKKDLAVIPLKDTSEILYEADFDFLDRHYSGLVIFKKSPSDPSIRISVLSKLGFRLLDMKYSQGHMTILDCLEFLDRDAFKKSMKSTFSLLLDHRETYRNVKYLEHQHDSSQYVLKACRRWNRYYYFFDNQLVDTIKVRAPFSIYERNHFFIGDYQQGMPQNIHIRHQNIRLVMEFNLLNQ